MAYILPPPTTVRCAWSSGDWVMCKLPLIAVILFLNMGFAYSQAEITGPLNGLTNVELLIENLSADSQTCGMTPQLLQDAFMFPGREPARGTCERRAAHEGLGAGHDRHHGAA